MRLLFDLVATSPVFNPIIGSTGPLRRGHLPPVSLFVSPAGFAPTDIY
jgi:hypothetical protein